MKSSHVAVTAAPPSAGDQSLGSVSCSTRSQQRLQNEDTASLLASARTVAIAVADGDLSEKSNEDDDNKEKENDGDQGEDSDDEDNKADDTNKPEGVDQANWFEGLVDSSLLEDDVPSQLGPWPGCWEKAKEG